MVPVVGECERVYQGNLFADGPSRNPSHPALSPKL